jgi:hypothetical protein
MRSPLTFNPPITIDVCETAGQEFGEARIGMERIAFEQELVARLAALVFEDLLVHVSDQC